MLASRRSSYRRLSLRITVAVVLIGLVLLASAPSLQAVSETPSVEWNRVFNGFRSTSVIQTADGGYAVVGYRQMFSPDVGGYVGNTAVLIKTDASGNSQWKKEYRTDVFGGNNTAVSVVQTADLEYMLFGESCYLVKTDAEGNVQWKKALGVGGMQTGIQASDGNYLLVGNTIDLNQENVAWLLKTDGQGNILWNKTFTGGIYVRAVIQTDDRGCALAGSWKDDFWFAKIDLNSNLQWSQTYSYGGPSDVHYVLSTAKTKDGGYILAGAGDWQASGGIVPWLIKIDSQGHEKWNLPYGHITNNGFGSVVQTDDEGYLVAYSHSPILDRMDSSGSEQWNITYADLSVVGLNYLSSSLIRTSDGGYAVVGTSAGSTIWLTKISPAPDVTPPFVSILSPKSQSYDVGDVPLTFTVNEPTSWIGYSLDGHDNVTITGNLTVSELSVGAHNLTVYAKDVAGNIGASVTIQLEIVGRFPVTWIFASVVIAAVVLVSLLAYFKRRTLLASGKQGIKSYFTKQRLIAFANNRMVRSLTIIGLCISMVFVQIFFPFFYFSSKSSNSTFEVGVTYVYERDDVGQIYSEVSHIRDLGISVIRVNMVSDSVDPNNYVNGLTDVFFSATQQLGMRVALIIQNHADANEIQYYLGRWGKYLSYIQVLNEPESASSWDVGALFTDDEAISNFQQVYSIIEQYPLPVQLYTNFGAGFLVRSNLPIRFSENLDFVGLDVFMDSFLTLSPNLVQLLHKIPNKDVAITEFGMSTSDDVAQSDFIIKGLNLFKRMGLRGCWIVYWNSAGDYYGIRGRLAEKAVGEWIAQNA